MTKPRGPKATAREEIERLREENSELVREKYRLEQIIRDMREAQHAAVRHQSWGRH